MVVLAGPAASAGAPGSGQAWLEAMTAALRAHAYEGLLSYAREDGVTELRLIHGHHGSAIYERLSRLDGEGKELLRRGDEGLFSRCSGRDPSRGCPTPGAASGRQFRCDSR